LVVQGQAVIGYGEICEYVRSFPNRQVGDLHAREMARQKVNNSAAVRGYGLIER
jgi:hypothetical protein